MNAVLLEFEDLLARKPAEVCKVLGLPYSTYAGYRASADPIPASVCLHINALRRLDAATLHELVRERVRG